MAKAPEFDLIDIAQALSKRRRIILIVTLACGLIAALFFLLTKRDYEAKAEFFVSNPQYADRNNLFRTNESQFLDYFTNEDDMDKVLAIANSENLRAKVVDRQGLYQIYQLDTGDRKDQAKMALRFRKNYKAKRTDNQSMEITYTDTNPELAANVANEAVRVVEDIYTGYFNDLRHSIYKAIERKADQNDSAIAVLTDSLAHMRDRYGIYDIISPTRPGIMNVGGMRSNGKPSFGRGVEEVQNIEAIKDQYVRDRAAYVSLMNEFSTGTRENELPLIHVITAASRPIEFKGLGLVLTIIAGMLIGLFFTAVSVLISAYYRKLLSVERN